MIIAISITLFFIVLRFTVTLFNFISNPKLTRVNRAYADLISILIPARNEAGNILTLLQSIHEQNYGNYEVIIYDDLSSDDTYRICSDFAAEHVAFSVIKGHKLPDGWTGKNYACYELAKQAKGKYFLFLNANTMVSANLINSAVHRLQLYKLALLSLFPNQQMETMGEKTTVPLLHYLPLNLLPIRLIHLSKSETFATACGQFMLFDATVYRQNQWHKLVKSKVVEAPEIMKQVKAAAYNGEVLLANNMICCRMYNGYPEAINGFSKNLPAAFNYSVLGLLLYILVIMGGPVLVITTLNLSLIFFMGGLIMLTRVMISLMAGQNAWYNMLLHPLQMMNLAVIAFWGIQRYLTRTLVWKERVV